MRKLWFLFSVFALTSVTSILSACAPSAWEGQKFVDFIVQDGSADGTPVRLSDYVGKGKYAVVDFWASWCGPCRGELPYLKSVYEKYGGDEFTVVSVAVWDDRKDTEKAIGEHGMTWPQILNAGKIPTDLYDIDGIPQIMLVGPDGTILKWNLRRDGIEKAVSQYVKARQDE